MHLLEECFEDMDQSMSNIEKSKIIKLELSLGILTDKAATIDVNDSGDPFAARSISHNEIAANYGGAMVRHGSIGSLSVQAPRIKEREASKAKQDQAKALVRRLAEEKKQREFQIKLKRDEDTLRMMESSKEQYKKDKERRSKMEEDKLIMRK